MQRFKTRLPPPHAAQRPLPRCNLDEADATEVWAQRLQARRPPHLSHTSSKRAPAPARGLARGTSGEPLSPPWPRVVCLTQATVDALVVKFRARRPPAHLRMSTVSVKYQHEPDWGDSDFRPGTQTLELLKSVSAHGNNLRQQSLWPRIERRPRGSRLQTSCTGGARLSTWLDTGLS